MKIERLLLALAASALFVTFSGCSKDDDDDSDPSNPPTGGGKVQITGLSDDYVFWGEELTITGSGFSNVKEENIVTFVNSYPRTPGLKLTSDGGDIEIVSASATNITIRIPYEQEEKNNTTIYRGEDYARIEVAVKSEKDTSDQVKFIGFPRIGGFEYHYGWYDLGGIARSGDSVVIDGGFYGSALGAGERHPKEAGVWDKLRLDIGGIPVAMKFRKITSSVDGFGIYLPVNDFSEVNCEDGANGWGDREMNFRFSVVGESIENNRKLFITYLPKDVLDGAEGPAEVSKSLGGNPHWTIVGKNMYYSHAVFVPECFGATNAETEIASGFYDDEHIYIPLSIMVENCLYKIYVKTPCDESKLIGSVMIKP